MKRPRLRKWAKWACTVAAGAAVGVAVASRFCSWDYSAASNLGDRAWSIGVASGQVLVVRTVDLQSLAVPRGWGWDIRATNHWYWGYSGEITPYRNVVTWHAGVLYAPLGRDLILGVSVLYPVLLTTIPAALLWYTDRRRSRPGACGACGYDRAGLAAEAKCPECGTVPAAAAM